MDVFLSVKYERTGVGETVIGFECGGQGHLVSIVTILHGIPHGSPLSVGVVERQLIVLEGPASTFSIVLMETAACLEGDDTLDIGLITGT